MEGGQIPSDQQHHYCKASDSGSFTVISMKHGQTTPTAFPTTPDKGVFGGGTTEPSMPVFFDKHSKRDAYKAQKQTYRSQKKEAAKELLSTITDPAVVLLGDWLKVRGTLKSWTKLWCVLKPGLLILYKSDKHKGSQWVGTILLNTCQLLERPSKKDGFCFKLFHSLDQSVWATRGPKGETIGAFVQPLPYSYCIFRAPSESAGKCWMDALELALKCTSLLKRSMTRLDCASDTAIDYHPTLPQAQNPTPYPGEEDQNSTNLANTFAHNYHSMRAQEGSMNDSDLERHFENQGDSNGQKIPVATSTVNSHVGPMKGTITEGLGHKNSCTCGHTDNRKSSITNKRDAGKSSVSCEKIDPQSRESSVTYETNYDQRVAVNDTTVPKHRISKTKIPLKIDSSRLLSPQRPQATHSSSGLSSLQIPQSAHSSSQSPSPQQPQCVHSSCQSPSPQRLQCAHSSSQSPSPQRLQCAHSSSQSAYSSSQSPSPRRPQVAYSSSQSPSPQRPQAAYSSSQSPSPQGLQSPYSSSSSPSCQTSRSALSFYSKPCYGETRDALFSVPDSKATSPKVGVTFAFEQESEEEKGNYTAPLLTSEDEQCSLPFVLKKVCCKTMPVIVDTKRNDFSFNSPVNSVGTGRSVKSDEQSHTKAFLYKPSRPSSQMDSTGYTKADNTPDTTKSSSLQSKCFIPEGVKCFEMMLQNHRNNLRKVGHLIARDKGPREDSQSIKTSLHSGEFNVDNSKGNPYNMFSNFFASNVSKSPGPARKMEPRDFAKYPPTNSKKNSGGISRGRLHWMFPDMKFYDADVSCTQSTKSSTREGHSVYDWWAREGGLFKQKTAEPPVARQHHSPDQQSQLKINSGAWLKVDRSTQTIQQGTDRISHHQHPSMIGTGDGRKLSIKWSSQATKHADFPSSSGPVLQDIFFSTADAGTQSEYTTLSSTETESMSSHSGSSQLTDHTVRSDSGTQSSRSRTSQSRTSDSEEDSSSDTQSRSQTSDQRRRRVRWRRGKAASTDTGVLSPASQDSNITNSTDSPSDDLSRVSYISELASSLKVEPSESASSTDHNDSARGSHSFSKKYVTTRVRPRTAFSRSQSPRHSSRRYRKNETTAKGSKINTHRKSHKEDEKRESKKRRKREPEKGKAEGGKLRKKKKRGR